MHHFENENTAQTLLKYSQRIATKKGISYGSIVVDRMSWKFFLECSNDLQTGCENFMRNQEKHMIRSEEIKFFYKYINSKSSSRQRIRKIVGRA